jgi:DNA-binding NarL/FixJ family response regulator
VIAGVASPRAVVLTPSGIDEHLYEVLRVGASGPLLKDAAETVIVAHEGGMVPLGLPG